MVNEGEDRRQPESKGYDEIYWKGLSLDLEKIAKHYGDLTAPRDIHVLIAEQALQQDKLEEKTQDKLGKEQG